MKVRVRLPQNKMEENGEGKTLSRKKKKKKKDNVDDKDGDESGDREESADVEKIEKNEVSDVDIDIDSTPLASLRKRVRVDASNVEKTAGNGDTATLSSKRERKKSKYFSPDFLSDFSWKGRKKSKNESESSKVSSQSQVGEQMPDASDSLVAEEEDNWGNPCEPAWENGLGHQELSKEELSNALDFLRLGATAEQMRDLIRVAALGTQYTKDGSSRDMLREFMSIYRSFTYNNWTDNKFLGSYNSSDKENEELNETGKPETKGKKRKEKKRKAKQQTEETEQIGKEENEAEKDGTTKKERKSKKPKSKKQEDKEEETLKESTKKERNQKKPKSKKQGDEEEETLKESSEIAKKERKRKKRESKKQADDDEEETLNVLSETTKKERKRKKHESKKQADDEEEETLNVLSETTKKERKRKKPQNEEGETLTETEKSEKKKKREGKSKKQKVDDEKIETKKAFSGAELYVTFGPGSSLPKKEDLIEIYEKFGALDEERTYMYVNNFCARVAFLNITDGEKAFESSQEKCPFASTSTVKFRLKYPNEKKAEAEVAETTTMEMEYVKKKLEEMRLLVDESEGGMSEEVKVKLEDEMVSLLEKVRKMKSS